MYFLQDRLSTRLITDSSGNLVGREDHLPFGEDTATGSGESEKHRFTSYERDNVSNTDYTDYAVNRQYATANGRFLQPDPIAGNAVDPQSMNRYSYVGNDPVNFSDPTGLFRLGPGLQPEPIALDPTQCYTLIVDGIVMGTIGNCGGGRIGEPERPEGPQNPGQKKEPCPPVPDHPANADIRANIAEAGTHGPASVFNPVKEVVDLKNMNWFYNQVRNKGPWDYKQQGRQYQDFGNFNFGATGLATGLFGETMLLQEAGRAQVKAGTSKPEWGYPPSLRHPRGQPPYGDDPADQQQIKNGFAYYYAVKRGCQ
jgi:RHS repeat-associated protein